MSDDSEDSTDYNNDEVRVSGELQLVGEVSYDENSSSESEIEPHPAEEVQFDTNIPTIHRYLGRPNNVSGYTLFDDGKVLTLLAIHTNTLVFPGFTLPLVLTDQVEQTLMLDYVTSKRIFALVCADEMGGRLYRYGVTMEVFETFSKHGTLSLKARGRQRCRILPNKGIRHLGDRLQQVTVKIIAEPDITSPISNTQLLALKARRNCSTRDYENLIHTYKYRRYHLAQYPYPSWVYDKNEVCFYKQVVYERLEKFYQKESIPTDPVSLSYWFIQNFQLAHEERLHLMKLDTTIERLKSELKFLEMERLICCAVCKANIANQNHVFAMSKDGVQSNYCNPGGFVYETVTVSEALNYKLIGSASKDFSWFPGYHWTIMQCNLCRGHIGWKFTSKYLQPREFFGLAKSGLDIKILNSDTSTEQV